MELSDILGGAPAPEAPASTVETPPPAPEPTAPVQETAPTTTVEQPAERIRDELGRFAKVEEPAEKPAEERPHTVPVAAMLEERRKRQELEARLAALQPKVPEVKDEDFWQAPTQAMQQLLTQQQQALQAQIQQQKYELAEDLTRTLHTDYDAVRDEFVALVEGHDPMAVAIAQQMGAHPNPAKFVYDQTLRLRAVKELGDPVSYRQRLEAELRAKLLAEMQTRMQPKPPEVPASLNSEPSQTVSSSPANFGPTPLENIVGYKF